MRNKIYLLGLIAIVLGNCTSPRYLPKASQVDVNEHGSFIKITRKAAPVPVMCGELIAIDSTAMVVLPKDSSRCELVYLDEVKRFSLRYAKPSHYWWTIPLGIALPYMNGYYSMFTLPIHLLVTVSETVSGEIDFKYSNRNMTFEKMAMFARFPQGIPGQVDLKMIR
jgi:hypothetical protein